MGRAPEGRLSFGSVTALLSAVGTGWILALMLLICADVLGRDLFNQPIPGVPELVAFSIVGIVFLQLAQTLRTGGLTRSDVLLAGILARHPRRGYALECVFNLTGVALFAIIIRTTWPLMVKAWEDGDFYGNIGVIQLPIWPLKLVIVIGSLAIALQFLIMAWQALRVIAGAAPPPAPARAGE